MKNAEGTLVTTAIRDISVCKAAEANFCGHKLVLQIPKVEG